MVMFVRTVIFILKEIPLEMEILNMEGYSSVSSATTSLKILSSVLYL